MKHDLPGGKRHGRRHLVVVEEDQRVQDALAGRRDQLRGERCLVIACHRVPDTGDGRAGAERRKDYAVHALSAALGVLHPLGCRRAALHRGHTHLERRGRRAKEVGRDPDEALRGWHACFCVLHRLLSTSGQRAHQWGLGRRREPCTYRSQLGSQPDDTGVRLADEAFGRPELAHDCRDGVVGRSGKASAGSGQVPLEQRGDHRVGDPSALDRDVADLTAEPGTAVGRLDRAQRVVRVGCVAIPDVENDGIALLQRDRREGQDCRHRVFRAGCGQRASVRKLRADAQVVGGQVIRFRCRVDAAEEQNRPDGRAGDGHADRPVQRILCDA